jgi:hypothetical protein
MRRVVFVVLTLSFFALAALPAPASAEVEKAVIDILGGMQCSL